MSTKITGQREVENLVERKMGVASPSTKRRLEGPESEPALAAKIPRRHAPSDLLTESDPSVFGSSENSSDFLTTSILARTLLTSSTNNNDLPPFKPLEKHLDSDPHHPFEPPTITLLSPIDEWAPRKIPLIQRNGNNINNAAPLHQVITEDENGKSYFNLGSADDTTIVARKTSPEHSTGVSWNNVYNNNSSGGSNCNDFDDNASSSSCESISSEDLFNSGEEFDGSDDEEEEMCGYKQQRSTVLHLSLCKLNKFRSQQCVEPSLHRSVLICNTLRYIEQEIKNEDEVDESLKSREKLPSFWRSTSSPHNCFNSPANHHSSQPHLTDSRPNVLLSPDPYLSPSPYTNNGNANGGESYLSYDYNSLRPTPYHTTSYEYDHDLLPMPNVLGPNNGGTSSANNPTNNPNLSNSQPDLSGGGGASSGLECDSGYGDDLDLGLSSYYYGPQGGLGSMSSLSSINGMNTNSSPPPAITSPPHSADSSIANISIGLSNVADSSYLTCGFSMAVDPVPGTNCNVSNGSNSNCSSSSSLSPPHRSESEIPSNPSDERLSDIPDTPRTSTTSSSSVPLSTSVTVTCHPPNSIQSNSTNLPPPSACDYHLTNGNGSLGQEDPNQMCWSTPVKMSTGLNLKEPTSNVSNASNGSPPLSPSGVPFAQQDSQCGMESRRSDLSHSSHFNNLPMDSLISSTYSSSL